LKENSQSPCARAALNMSAVKPIAEKDRLTHGEIAKKGQNEEEASD